MAVNEPKAPLCSTLGELEQTLERCAMSSSDARLQPLLKSLRLDLQRMADVAEAEFDYVSRAPQSAEPYADATLGLVALSGAIAHARNAHDETLARVTGTRTRLLLEGQLERLRSMERQLERHAA
ncbi:MAG: hypothetical protein ACE37F_21795 [Nannocystaceae bacterium]|nr:hypothetical protein [bacterium]